MADSCEGEQKTVVVAATSGPAPAEETKAVEIGPLVGAIAIFGLIGLAAYSVSKNREKTANAPAR